MEQQYEKLKLSEDIIFETFRKIQYYVSGRRGKLKSRVRDYILYKDSGRDVARPCSIVNKLNKKFLSDVDLGAGLAVYLYEMGGMIEAMLLNPHVIKDLNEFYKLLDEHKQEVIVEITDFFGAKKENYKSKLEKMINLWEVEAEQKQS